MVKPPAIGQRSIRAASVSDGIICEINFRKGGLAEFAQLWLLEASPYSLLASW
jgi:hypothetical protein